MPGYFATRQWSDLAGLLIMYLAKENLRYCAVFRIELDPSNGKIPFA